MLRLICVVVACGLAIGPALGQVTGSVPGATPTLKREVTVTSDLVRIGDLVDNAGAFATTPIFRAPDPGETGAVAAYRVADAVRPYGLTLDTRDISEVTVSHAGHVIGAKDVQAALARALSARFGLGKPEDLAFTFDTPIRPVHLQPSIPTELEPREVAYERRWGRFDVTLAVAGTNIRDLRFRYTGVVIETREVLITTNTVARGELVRQSDIVVERRPKVAAGDGAFTVASDAIGLAARHSLGAGVVLRNSDLMRPEMIHQDDQVMLIYQVPGITLTVRGKAVNSGAEGDIVGVINLQSNQTIHGKVVAPGQVRVASSEPSLAAQPATTQPDSDDATR
jgi:flagella basal body P-ring formation protein FlgA